MMDDLISRQAAIEVAKQYWYKPDIAGALAELPSVTLQPNTGHWIPCSERLPRPYEQVLRTVKSFGWNCTPHTHVDIGTICPIDTDVIAWMPLPEPYKAERTEE